MRESLSIQSRNNPKVKAVVALKDSKTRRQTALFTVEGFHEIGVALQYGYPVDSVFFTNENNCQEILEQLDDAVSRFHVSSHVFEKFSNRQNPDGILFVCKQKPLKTLQEHAGEDKTVLILDGVEKPGNHGAILRSAAAFGVETVILSSKTTDPFNPQVIRNSRGHSLGFKLYHNDPTMIVDWLGQHGYTSFVASPDASEALQQIDFSGKTAIVLGSEHDGVSDFWKRHADRGFRIPMTQKVDSLNVSISASIVLYEVFKNKISCGN